MEGRSLLGDIKRTDTHQNMSLGSIIWWLQYKLWSQTACVQILALTVISCVISGTFLNLIVCQFLLTALNAQRCTEDFNDYYSA